MSDDKSIPASDREGRGYVGKDSLIQEQQDAEIHKLREQAGDDAIPRDAGDDFTFPDEDKTLGRKTGDDLPGEPSDDRR